MCLVDIHPPWVLLNLDFALHLFLFSDFSLRWLHPIPSLSSLLTFSISSLSFCEQTRVCGLLTLHDFIAFDHSPFHSPSSQAKGPLDFFFLVNLFIYFWLCWVFVAARGLSLVAASWGYSSLRCAGISLWWLLLLRSMGSRCVGFSSCGSQALELRLSSCGAQA